MQTETTDETPEITRMDNVELDEAIERITELPNTRLGTRGKVWATFHTDADEVAAVCEIAFKEPNVVMRKADAKDGCVSIALEKFVDYL